MVCGCVEVGGRVSSVCKPSCWFALPVAAVLGAVLVREGPWAVTVRVCGCTSRPGLLSVNDAHCALELSLCLYNLN